MYLFRTSSNLSRKRKFTPVSATVSRAQSEAAGDSESQSQVLNVNVPQGPAQISTGLQPGTSGIVAVDAAEVEVVDSAKELAETPKPKAKTSKKHDDRNELHTKIFQFLERETEREIPEPVDHPVDLQLRSIGLQIKEALNVEEQRRVLYRMQGVVLDFIDEKNRRNVINNTVFEQNNFLAPGSNEISVSTNSMAPLHPVAGNVQTAAVTAMLTMQPIPTMHTLPPLVEASSFVTESQVTLQQL